MGSKIEDDVPERMPNVPRTDARELFVPGSCDLLTRGPEQDQDGHVHFTRVLVPASGVHHNKMVYATRMYDRVPNIGSF